MILPDWNAKAELHRLEPMESEPRLSPKYLQGRDASFVALVNEVMKMPRAADQQRTRLWSARTSISMHKSKKSCHIFQKRRHSRLAHPSFFSGTRKRLESLECLARALRHSTY